jgi:hypothetical protein
MCYYGWEGGTGLVCPGFAWRWRYDDSDDSGLHFFLFGGHAFLSFFSRLTITKTWFRASAFRLEVCGSIRVGHGPIAAAITTD